MFCGVMSRLCVMNAALVWIFLCTMVKQFGRSTSRTRISEGRYAWNKDQEQHRQEPCEFHSSLLLPAFRKYFTVSNSFFNMQVAKGSGSASNCSIRRLVSCASWCGEPASRDERCFGGGFSGHDGETIWEVHQRYQNVRTPVRLG